MASFPGSLFFLSLSLSRTLQGMGRKETLGMRLTVTTKNISSSIQILNQFLNVYDDDDGGGEANYNKRQVS